MIVITGATGQLGRAIVKNLVERLGAGRVGASCRDPDKAGDLAALGVRVRPGDFDRPDDLAHAFEGATQLLLVSSNARASGGDALAQHRNVINAANKAGVTRIVYTSQMAAADTSAFPPMHDHAATEAMLRESGLKWTALRHGFYASSGLMFMQRAFQSGEIVTAQDGPYSWVAHADLATAAAAVLAEEGRFDGPTPPLTGPEALDFGDLARIATDLGTPVERKVVSDENMKQAIIAQGRPPHVAEMLVGMYVGGRNGEWAEVNPTLGELIGRDRIRMGALIAEVLAKELAAK